MKKTAPVIEMRDISFAYGKKLVLDSVSLIVDKGEFLGLTGPNGSGKTTLLKVLLGLLKPLKGEVFLFGVDIKRFKEWYRIGYVPQKPVLESNFPATVEEVVATGRFSRVGLGRSLKKNDLKAIEDALEIAGISRLRSQPVTQLSGGQQQRVFIARALAGEPELLVLDEPQSGLDTRALQSFYSLLRELNKTKKMTILMVFHGPEAEHWAQRIAYLNRTLFSYTPNKKVQATL
ncbi:MAG: Zinc uptake system ATP-binding protein ZurA [Thermoanaerobacterales bacterium 50_218]|nr:MAG: Zinc uptake system ATP-binding protein ZurA [Thermoanaerobacterales bacterium 50_218]